MSKQSGRRAKYVSICFFTIWCVAAFGMGIFVLRNFPFGESGAPFIVDVIPLAAPFGMGFIGLVLLISIVRSEGKEPTPVHSYGHETIVYTGDYTSDLESLAREKDTKKSYRALSVCPSCGAPIRNRDVRWVGPLQGKCPYCDEIFEAE